MTTFTFYPTDGAEYDGPQFNYAYEGHTGNGRDYVEGDGGDYDHSLLIFNSNAIRTALAGYNITACTLSFNIDYLAGGGPYRVHWGTHNYTAVPTDRLSTSRINTSRVIYFPSGAGQVNGLDLGTTIGAELRDGVSTGLIIGDPGNSGHTNSVGIRPQDNNTYRPALVITAALANTAPNAPTLNSPAAGAVVDGAASIGFNWTHSDPQGDPMNAFYFRRNKGGGTYDYWNGSAFVSTETRLTTATVPLPNGIMTIPGGVWGNGQSYSWSVATEDPSGLKGPYASDRSLYTSTPPTVTITGPTDASTITSSRPTVSWTFSDINGQPQYGWAAQIVPSSVYSDPGFNPDNYLNTAWSGSGTGTQTSTTINKDLVNHTTYRAYVKVSSSPNPSGGLQWSPWAYVTFSVVIPPYAPQITSPQNGSTADLGTTGFTLGWNDTFFSNVGSQTAFAIRRISGGSYQWWNGGSWGSTETFLAGSARQFTFRAGEVPNGSTYTFSVAIRDDYNQVSPYSTGATVTAATVAQVSVVAPEGVSVTAQPVVTWTMYQAENDPQQTYQIKILNASDVVFPGTGAFDPTSVTAVWDTGEVNDALTRNVQVGPDLTNNASFYVFVRIKSGGLYTSWAYQPFNIFLVPPGTPLITTVPNNDAGLIEVIVQGRDSMLTDVASRNAAGFGPLASTGNCTVVNGIFFASAQSHLASEVTATNAGTMTVCSMDMYAVQPGFAYTGAATIIAPVGVPPVPAYAIIHWYDSSGALISTSYGQSFADQSAVRSVVSASAPDAAAMCCLGVQWQNVPHAGDKHRFFDPVLRPSTGGEWSPGGLLGDTTVDVTELGSGRTLRRGAGVPMPSVTQQVTITDEEAPIGAPQIYQAVTRAVYPGATLASETAVSAPASWTSGFLWLSDPIRIGSGRLFNPQSFDATTKPIRQGLFRPLGRPDALLVTGVRGLREGSFTIVTYSKDERDALDSMLAESEVLLLRYPPDQGDTVGEAVYFRTKSDAPVARPLESRTQHRTITVSWIEQVRPTSLLNFDGSDA